MDVAITGSHGLIGKALAASLEADGHSVRPVVRSGGGAGAVTWDLDAGRIDAAGLEGVHAVVHLAGEGIASARWTEEQKRRIHDSRTQGTTLLSGAIAGLDQKPKALVSGSAIGIYGSDRGDHVLTETSGLGHDFLAGVCKDWEASTALAEEAGIRVAHLRSGVVLSGKGGALATQLPIFKLGLGGPAGSGRQWLSWVSLDDEVAAIRFLIDHDVSGPVNVAAPAAVTNAEFTKALGRALRRPTFLRIPRLVAKAPMGIGDLAGSLLFASQRVAPAVLEANGFRFSHPDLDGALQTVI